MSRLQNIYPRFLGETYVKDGDEFITCYEAEHWLQYDQKLTDVYDEVYVIDEETGEYESSLRAYETLVDLENELFGEDEGYAY